MIKPIGLFHTPKDWDELQLWIDSITSCDKIIVLTAAAMAWNLAAKETNNEDA
jgi:hypothetical protein